MTFTQLLNSDLNKDALDDIATVTRYIRHLNHFTLANEENSAKANTLKMFDGFC